MVYFPLIVKQGDPADGMFFVEVGIVEVFVDGASGTRKKVSDIEKGGYFGELALVTHKPRAASVIAQSDVRLACKYFQSAHGLPVWHGVAKNGSETLFDSFLHLVHMKIHLMILFVYKVAKIRSQFKF